MAAKEKFFLFLSSRDQYAVHARGLCVNPSIIDFSEEG
jgi:hypothetical protein